MPLRIFLVAGVIACLASCKTKDSRPSSKEALKAFPYAAHVDSGDHPDGVQFWDKDRAYRGLTLLVGSDGLSAVLIDMKGNVRHRISFGREISTLHHVHLTDNGDLFGIYSPNFAGGFESKNWTKISGIAKASWNGDIIWNQQRDYTRAQIFSHEIAIDDSGNIYSISDDFVRFDHKGKKIKLRDDAVVKLDPQGNEVRRFKMFPITRKYYPEAQLDRVSQGDKGWHLRDITHMNALSFLPRDIEGVGSKGDWLVSFREHNLVAVLDAGDQSVKWSWGANEISAQHQPTVVANDHLLIFDNGVSSKTSRVIELDPKTNTIVWQYGASQGETFYSRTRGGAQRLPNGNTLIVSSNQGRIFEVTPEKKVVWDYYTNSWGTKGRTAPYRARRLGPKELARLPFSAEQRKELETAGYLP